MMDPDRLARAEGVKIKLIDLALRSGERTNDHRAEEASLLMECMYVMTGVDHSHEGDGPETALGDVLAHLMHYADVRAVDFESALESGAFHYRCEIIELPQGGRA